jgi:hypothetical protein
LALDSSMRCDIKTLTPAEATSPAGHMFRKYSILLGIPIALFLLLVSTLNYPGGSHHDKNSLGYDWKNNYLSNLFTEKAVNGSANAFRVWAISGMSLLCVSFALFFIEFPKKISSKGAATAIRTCGVCAMIFSFFGRDTLPRQNDYDCEPTGSDKHVLHNSVRIQVKIALPKTCFRWFAYLFPTAVITFITPNGGVAFLPVVQKIALVTTIP